MINEWKNYYNNDYIIFSINNGIVNDQYFSTKHILNTYQSRVEFIIDNIEDFSFKNEDYINSLENDFHINYAQQLLEGGEYENKIKDGITKNDLSLKCNIESSTKETSYTKLNNDRNEKSGNKEGHIIEKNENNLLNDESLKEEDLVIDNVPDEKKELNHTNKGIDEKQDIGLNNKFIKEERNISKGKSESELNDKSFNEKRVCNLPLQKHDNNKKFEFENSDKENLSSINEKHKENSSSDKIFQKDLTIQIEKNDSPKEDSKEGAGNYDRKNDNYKTLINDLKNQKRNVDGNKYYSRVEKIENYTTEDKNSNCKDKNIYQNENENFQISNSLNSNNSHEFNNFNSENNDVPEYDKYPKIFSRTQSYTTRSRDDEIKSLNDKLYSYRNQNKVILDENKKLLEIINIFKILQNLENSKKSINPNHINSVNENLDSDGINREIEIMNKNNDVTTIKDNQVNNIIEPEGNTLKKEDKFNKNQAFDNYEFLEFENFEKKEKKSIKNIDFSYANKFLNSNKYVSEKINSTKHNKNENNFRGQNSLINNRYDNISESSNITLRNKLIILEQDQEEIKKDQEQRDINEQRKISITSDDIYNTKKLIINHDFNKELKLNVKDKALFNKYTAPNDQINDFSVNSSNNIISPTNYDSKTKIINNFMVNRKKTFIKIDDNFQNKGSYYSKNFQGVMNSAKSNKNKIIDHDKNFLINKVNYINTNSIPIINLKLNSKTNKSNNMVSQPTIVLSENQKSLKIKKNNDQKRFENNNNVSLYKQGIFSNEFDKDKDQNLEREVENNSRNINFRINSSDFQDNNQNIDLRNNKDNKELKNYNHLIQYLEKYKELNDRLIETLENEKKDVKIDMNKRKKDVEYLEHILSYISSLGDNKESKDFIPFYLIDRRKLFENMVKYLYSKDEMSHSTKHKNVRLYKMHNKIK